jgi:ribonucleoside-diphosphate reductase alpha chain
VGFRFSTAPAGYTRSFRLGDTDGTLTTASRDGKLDQIFLRAGDHGSTLAGMTDAFSVAASLALQHGAPLEEIAEELRGTRFEPAGHTDDPDIGVATSLMDYTGRRLLADFPPR